MMKHYVILADAETVTYPSDEFDTVEEANEQVDKYRQTGLPAYTITGADYKEFTGRSAHKDYLKNPP